MGALSPLFLLGARPFLALALLVLSGCGTKYTRVPVLEDGLTTVVLRATKEGGAPG